MPKERAHVNSPPQGMKVGSSRLTALFEEWGGHGNGGDGRPSLSEEEFILTILCKISIISLFTYYLINLWLPNVLI